MRVYENTQLTISEDTTTAPKRIRLSETFIDADTTLIPEIVQRQETFPVGSHTIGLGNITQGRWLYVYPKAANVQLQLNGSNALTLRANKVSRMWVIFTGVVLIVSTAPAEVLIVLGGE